MRRLCLYAGLLLIGLTPAGAADNPQDPWEGFNRKMFAFNDTVDRWFLKPVARGYQAVTPQFVDRSVTRFFGNLHDVVDAANFALQGEPVASRNSAFRVFANTTVGLGGLLDPASSGGIPNEDTHFGITLGKWGVGSGNYLVLPFMGPSTVRDTAGKPVDWVLHPLDLPWTVVQDEGHRNVLSALAVVDARADLLEYEQAVTGDRYSFLRDIYLQRSDFKVNGAPEKDPFLDEDFDAPADAPTEDAAPAPDASADAASGPDAETEAAAEPAAP